MAAKVNSFPAQCCLGFSSQRLSYIIFGLMFLVPNLVKGQDRNEFRNVLICFTQAPDWSGQYLPSEKAARGEKVFQLLQNQALQQQSAVRQYLEGLGITYSAFSVVNAIQAELTESQVEAVTKLPFVSSVANNTAFVVERTASTPAPFQTRSVAPEWGIVHIKADQVWAMGYTGQGVVVADKDTGVDWDHPALVNSYRGTEGIVLDHNYNWHDAIHSFDPANGDTLNPCGLNTTEPCDDNGHGTHTTGTMTGLDGENTIGVAPGAKWIACRNMERGWGRPSTYLECLEWMLAPTDLNGENPDPARAPHVINNSWSCTEAEGCDSTNYEIMRQAVVNMRAAGIVMVVSAGNSGNDCGSVSTPLAMFEESFSVGAIRANDTIAGFSSRGPVVVDSSFRIKPNISAPGVQVRSSWIGDDLYRNANGTSMAGPHVAGVVALMISANPALAGQVEVIETILETTARHRTTDQECGGVSGSADWNNTYGHGVVDALAAVEAALAITDVDDPIRKDELTFFPNPVRDQLFIRSGHLSVVQDLQIIAMDGRTMFTSEFIELPAAIEVGSYPSGLYMVYAKGTEPFLIHITGK